MSTLLSNATTKKVYIQVETAAEQQEHLKNQRRTLKVLQGVATDKENLTGRTQLDKLSRLKAAAINETTISTSTIDDAQRKKIETKDVEIQTSPNSKLTNASQITAEDLCSEVEPGEHYFERLAEKRREALEPALAENRHLYERIDGLEEELNTSRQQLEEAKNLVEVLKEIICEFESGQQNEEDATALPEVSDTETDDSAPSAAAAEN